MNVAVQDRSERFTIVVAAIILLSIRSVKDNLIQVDFVCQKLIQLET